MADSVLRLFEAWDKEGSGEIARDELQAILARLCPTFTPRDLALLTAGCGRGDGVRYRAFIDFVFGAGAGPPAAGQPPPLSQSVSDALEGPLEEEECFSPSGPGKRSLPDFSLSEVKRRSMAGADELHTLLSELEADRDLEGQGAAGTQRLLARAGDAILEAVDVSAAEAAGLTPLGRVAAMSAHLPDELLVGLVRRLVEAKADTNCRCPRTRQTPLHHLAGRCNREAARECAQLLLEARANPRLKTKMKNDVLAVAGQKKNLYLAELLLEATGQQDWFQWAASVGVLALLRKLLAARVGPEAFARMEPGDSCDVEATNSLRTRCFFHRDAGAEELEELVRRRADVNAENNYGERALHYASRGCSLEAVECLLRCGASPNARSNDVNGGCVPLHYAAKADRPEVCRALLAARAWPGEMDAHGISPWMLSPGPEVQELEAAGAAAFCSSLVAQGGSLEQGLEALRLREQFFFQPESLSRAPQEPLLLRVWAVCEALARRTAAAETALSSQEKKLLRHLLLCTRGPRKVSEHWGCADNRRSYRGRYEAVAEELLQGFAVEAGELRREIRRAAEAGCGACAEFEAVPAESLCIPAPWADGSPEWREAAAVGRLRTDLPGVVPAELVMGGVRSLQAGASAALSGLDCFLGLRRVGAVASVREYSDLVSELQIGGNLYTKLNAKALAAYAALANERFHAAVGRLLDSARQRAGCLEDVRYTQAPAKKYQRVWEKTLESKREEKERQQAGEPDNHWSFLHSDYQRATHAAYLLDMNRGAIVAHGARIQDQVVQLVELRRRFRALSLEADGAAVLREKSGYTAPPVPGGYFDVKLFLLLDLGSFEAADGAEVPLRVVGELQLILEGMLAIKSRMHVAYEVSRGSFEWPSARAGRHASEQEQDALLQTASPKAGRRSPDVEPDALRRTRSPKARR